MTGAPEQINGNREPAKADIYADALIVALAETAERLGGPDINAALSALTFTQAYLIAKVTDRNDRRLCIKECHEALQSRTAQLVNDRIAKEQQG